MINALFETSGVCPGGGAIWECAVVAAIGDRIAAVQERDRCFTLPNLAVLGECEKVKEGCLRAADVSPYDQRALEISMTEPAPPTTEQTLWTGTVSNFHYTGKWILIAILVLAIGASFWLRLPDYNPVLWAARAVLGILALILIGWIQLDRRRRRYAVTNRRVSAEFGIISRVSNEVRVQDIRSINLRQTGLLGLLGIGRVEFSSAAADDAEVIFWNIPEAEKVRDLVRSLQT